MCVSVYVCTVCQSVSVSFFQYVSAPVSVCQSVSVSVSVADVCVYVCLCLNLLVCQCICVSICQGVCVSVRLLCVNLFVCLSVNIINLSVCLCVILTVCLIPATKPALTAVRARLSPPSASCSSFWAAQAVYIANDAIAVSRANTMRPWVTFRYVAGGEKGGRWAGTELHRILH